VVTSGCDRSRPAAAGRLDRARWKELRPILEANLRWPGKLLQKTISFLLFLHSVSADLGRAQGRADAGGREDPPRVSRRRTAIELDPSRTAQPSAKTPRSRRRQWRLRTGEKSSKTWEQQSAFIKTLKGGLPPGGRSVVSQRQAAFEAGELKEHRISQYESSGTRRQQKNLLFDPMSMNSLARGVMSKGGHA